MLSTETTLISSYKSGMESRVLLENSHRDPDFPAIDSFDEYVHITVVAADGSN